MSFTSAEPNGGYNPVTQRQYDGVNMTKVGGELTYSMLPWLAASFRGDHVINDDHDSSQTFTVVSPRLIFRSKWQAHDQVVLQYSHWIDGAPRDPNQPGSGVRVRDGYPATQNLALAPDKDMISLSASMWW